MEVEARQPVQQALHLQVAFAPSVRLSSTTLKQRAHPDLTANPPLHSASAFTHAFGPWAANPPTMRLLCAPPTPLLNVLDASWTVRMKQPDSTRVKSSLRCARSVPEWWPRMNGAPGALRITSNATAVYRPVAFRPRTPMTTPLSPVAQIYRHSARIGSELHGPSSARAPVVHCHGAAAEWLGGDEFELPRGW